MSINSQEDLQVAIATIEVLIKRSEKIKVKLKEGSSQYSLVNNRLKALYLAKSFIEEETNGIKRLVFTQEDLNKAIFSILSTIKKCEKAKEKLKENSSQYIFTLKIITSLNIALTFINNKLN